MTTRSTPRLITAFVMCMVGIIASVISGLPEVAIVVAPWFIAAALTLSRGVDRDVRVRVSVDAERVVQGDEVEIALRITSITPAFVEIRPQPTQRFRERAPTVSTGVPVVDAVSADEPTTVRIPVTLDDWGTWDLGRGVVSVQDPFGFLQLDGAIRADHQVRVHPTSERLSELVGPTAVRRVTGVHPSRASGRGIEYADIRRYQPGDALRDINWRASARTGELQVSDRHPDRGADVLLLLDSFVESGHDLERVLGMAVRACLALAQGHLGVTDRVGLIEFGGVVRWVEPGSGGVQLHKLTDALLASSLFANAAAKELPSLPPRIWSPRALVVALTPLLDERFVDALVAARSRGHDVVVLECSPMEPLRDPTPLEAVSLGLWEAERSLARTKLVEHGIAVAGWTPEEPVDAALAEISRRRHRTQVRAR